MWYIKTFHGQRHGFNYHLISALRKCLIKRGERGQRLYPMCSKSKVTSSWEEGMSRWTMSLVFRKGEKVLACFIGKYKKQKVWKRNKILQPWLSFLLPIFIFPNRNSCGSAAHDAMNSTQVGLCSFQRFPSTFLIKSLTDQLEV